MGENIDLKEKLGEHNQAIQEIDYKYKAIMAEKELLSQQLAFQERLKKEELDKAKMHTAHAVSDFKDQCSKIRIELEQAYKQKLEKKLAKFKQDYAIGRESEVKLQYQLEMDTLKRTNEQLLTECNKAKKELRRSMMRQKLLKQQEQENITRIEEEVQKSLAKVMSSSSVNKSTSNPVKRSSPFLANRSYQSINVTGAN